MQDEVAKELSLSDLQMLTDWTPRQAAAARIRAEVLAHAGPANDLIDSQPPSLERFSSSFTPENKMLPQVLASLPFVKAPIPYLKIDGGEACYRAWPNSSGRASEVPPKALHDCTIYDCRALDGALTLEDDGFLFLRHRTAFADFLDDERVRLNYYPEIEEFLKALTGAAAVFAFDHNLRSAGGPLADQPGVRTPADIAHGDYTHDSGPRRTREILEARRYPDRAPARTLLVNVWRPLHGPVVDRPLAICHAASVRAQNLVATPIEHYSDGDLVRPSHRGEILSLSHDPAHRWFYASQMQADEVLAFKTFDSDERSPTRFTPHTAFVHPHPPASYRPRESFEIRTLVVEPRRPI